MDSLNLQTVIVQPVLAASRARHHRRRQALVVAAPFLTLLLYAVLLQWLAGAYSAEFSGYPDEPAHYMSGLMVADYLRQGLPEPPVRFAENYYLHYPKVAFGMWGPLFPLIDGAWMAVFGGSRVSILLLMAVITALLATTLYRVIRTEFSAAAGLLAALALVSLPVVQTYGAMVMGDNLCALLAFWAALAFGRYVETGRARHSVLFGIFASLSILAKPSGWALALLPVTVLALTRRWRLLATRAFWYPAAIVLILAGPWQYWEFKLLNEMRREVSLETMAGHLVIVATAYGRWLAPVLAAGIFARVIAPIRSGTLSPRWAAMAGLVFSVWAYHSLVPTGGAEPRYMIAAFPALAMFLAAGIEWLAVRLPRTDFSLRAKAAALALAAATIFAADTFAIPHKRYHGYTELARFLLSQPELRDVVFLVSSESNGEGMFISELAMQEKRPGHIILRASKVLAQSDWMGGRYRVLYPAPQDIMAYLDSIPVRVLIIDGRPARTPVPHHRDLLKTLQTYAHRWRLIGSFPRTAAAVGPNIDVYRLTGRDGGKGKVRIELPYTLGRPIEQR